MENNQTANAGADWLTLDEASSLLRRKYKAIRRLIETGEIYRDPNHGRILISRASVEAYSRRVAAGTMAVAA